MERVGRVGDGGKWMCGIEYLASRSEPCVMYSYGIRGDVSFEVEVVEASTDIGLPHTYLNFLFLKIR